MYFGASNTRFGGNGSVLSLNEKIESAEDPNNPIFVQFYPAISGILEEEAIAILKQFYDQENMNGTHSVPFN